MDEFFWCVSIPIGILHTRCKRTSSSTHSQTHRCRHTNLSATLTGLHTYTLALSKKTWNMPHPLMRLILVRSQHGFVKYTQCLGVMTASDTDWCLLDLGNNLCVGVTPLLHLACFSSSHWDVCKSVQLCTVYMHSDFWSFLNAVKRIQFYLGFKTR